MSLALQDRQAPFKVLIVKLSSLGDVVHAMPAVMDIHAAFPNAQIDWVVERGFAPLAARCTAVHRVIPCEIRKWRKAFFKAESRAQTRAEWQAFKADLQQEAYDVILDLQGLTKSALVAWLARQAKGGKRYALANRTDGSGYERPTRWVADVAVPITPHIHAVERGRVLCAKALGYEVPAHLNYREARKSTTAPPCTRSQRLLPPPVTIPKPNQRSTVGVVRSRHSKDIGSTTRMPIAMKNQRCHPPASAKNENAAPVLRKWTKLNQGVTGTD